MLTQMLRTPEDIAQLKSSAGQDWGKEMPELEEVYAAQRSETDPPTVREYLTQQNPGQADELAWSIARKLMDHRSICQSFNNMHWLVLDVPKDEYSLLTSDRPIQMSRTLTEDDAIIIMPIGSRRLFTAVAQLATQLKLKTKRRGDSVKAVNKLIVQHAVKYVYGLNDSMLPFVQKHMATRRYSTLLERLAAKHGHKIIAPDRPI